MTIETIIASTVVAAIVSGIFTKVEKQKANSLQYITQERCVWRQNIREIIKKITTTNDPGDIREPLAELKTWIDPRGLKWSGSIYDDYHIWKTINQLEKAGNAKFLEDKQLLINFLCVSLKQDWRRSNQEVQDSESNVKGKVLFLVSIILYIFIYRHKVNGALPVVGELLINPKFMFLATSFTLIWNVPEIARWQLIQVQRHSEKELTRLKIKVWIYIVYVVLQVINLFAVFIFGETRLAKYDILIPLALMIVSSHMRLQDMQTKFNFAKAYYFSIIKLLEHSEGDIDFIKGKKNKYFEKYHIPQQEERPGQNSDK